MSEPMGDGESRESKLYFMDVKINIGIQGGVDLPGFITKVSNILCSYSTATKCLYKFKVTGEPRLVAVFEVFNVIGLERTLSGIGRLGYVDITCEPLLVYETFADNINVDQTLCQPSPRNITGDQELFWCQFDVDYHGKTMDQLLSTWKKEATTALGARAQGLHLELFKVVAQRKVHVLIGNTSNDMDKLSFTLPLMKEQGDGVKITCRSIQDLNHYTEHISKDNL